MTHNFDLRLEADYGKENAVERLNVENRVDDEWQPLDLNEATPGFLVFVYAILTCQHMFMRVIGLERGLLYRSSRASMQLQADDEWRLDAMRLHFDVALARGTPTRDDIDTIIARMEGCPVSRNLPDSFKVDTTLNFSRDDG